MGIEQDKQSDTESAPAKEPFEPDHPDSGGVTYEQETIERGAGVPDVKHAPDDEPG